MFNVGSLFLVVAIVWQFFRNKSEHDLYISIFIITVFVGLFVERGYFISLGTQQISYKMFSEFFLFTISIIFLMRRKILIKKSLFRKYFILLLVLLIGWILLVLFPSEATGGTSSVSWDMILVSGYPRQPIVFNSSMYIYILQVFMYLVNAVAVLSCFSKNDWMIILEKIEFLSSIILFIGIVEFVVVYSSKSNVFYDIIDAILGKSASTMEIRFRGSGFGLCGLTKESSHYVFVLSVMFILNTGLDYYRKIRKNSYYFKQIAIIALMIFSMSFSSVYFVICLLLLLLSLRFERSGFSNMKFFVIMFGVVILSIIILNSLQFIAEKVGMESFLGRRIYSVVEEYDAITSGRWLNSSTALEWSNRVRLGSTYETFKLVLFRPLFGLGFASTTAHSSLAMLVSGLGIIGTYVYFRFMFFLRDDYFNYNKAIYVTCIFVYLFFNVFNSMGFRPFYDSWTILLVFVFQLLSAIPNNGNKILVVN